MKQRVHLGFSLFICFYLFSFFMHLSAFFLLLLVSFQLLLLRFFFFFWFTIFRILMFIFLFHFLLHFSFYFLLRFNNILFSVQHEVFVILLSTCFIHMLLLAFRPKAIKYFRTYRMSRLTAQANRKNHRMKYPVRQWLVGVEVKTKKWVWTLYYLVKCCEGKSNGCGQKPKISNEGNRIECLE